MSAEVERWRKARSLTTPNNTLITPGDALAAALEAERRRVAELEAGVEKIKGKLPGIDGPTYDAWVIARDLLAGRAAGGEG